jgi:hypothetical protein
MVCDRFCAVIWKLAILVLIIFFSPKNRSIARNVASAESEVSTPSVTATSAACVFQ